MGGDLEMTMFQVDVVDKFMQQLVQHYTAFTEPHKHQGEFKGHSGWEAELTSGVGLVYSVLQQCFDMREGPIPGTISRDAYYGRLHKVVEATEEVSEHSARTNYPDS